jgi:hypothetical protein
MLIPFGVLSAAGVGGIAGGSYELIESAVLTSTQNSITFSNLGTYSSTYKHLQIRMTARKSGGTGTSGVLARFNGNSSAIYDNHFLVGVNSTVSSSSLLNIAGFNVSNLPSAGTTANVFSASVLDILDFSSSTKNKVIRSLVGNLGFDSRISLFSGSWRNQAAITSIELLADDNLLVAGSRFSLYGIK